MSKEATKTLIKIELMNLALIVDAIKNALGKNYPAELSAISATIANLQNQDPETIKAGLEALQSSIQPGFTDNASLQNELSDALTTALDGIQAASVPARAWTASIGAYDVFKEERLAPSLAGKPVALPYNASSKVKKLLTNEQSRAKLYEGTTDKEVTKDEKPS